MTSESAKVNMSTSPKKGTVSPGMSSTIINLPPSSAGGDSDSISLSSLNINETMTSTDLKETTSGQGSTGRSSSVATSSTVTTMPVPRPVTTPIRSSSPPNGTTGSDRDSPTPQPKLKSILPSSTLCIHTPCYCEENIWLLCDKIRSEYSTELEYCIVAFISNPRRMVPLWRQKSGKTEDKLAVWDYHVILLYNPDDRCVVYDLDSDLPFPTHFHKYVTETFRTENILQPEYHRFFRILHASDFLRLFSSDRTHMTKQDGTFLHPPPPYPPIHKNGINNLEEFLDMTTAAGEKTEYGEVLPLMDLVRKFFKRRL